jgi:hypothetical protein
MTKARGIVFRGTPEERFWQKTVVKGPDDCWRWKARLSPDGYGNLRIGKKRIRAHRFSWMLHNVEIPVGRVICHRCNNPWCVNPKHLYAGTMLENMRDCWGGGRMENRVRGERCHKSKLTQDDIISIRTAAARGISARELAAEHGVTRNNIDFIVSRRTWRHVP